MDHPDIRYIERYGYTKESLQESRPVGVCLFCGSDIYKDGSQHIRSFDGLFCDLECCHSYYEIDTKY